MWLEKPIDENDMRDKSIRVVRADGQGRE